MKGGPVHDDDLVAFVALDCGHPYAPDHTMGQRLVHCPRAGCGRASVVTAHVVTAVLYDVAAASTELAAAAAAD